MLSSAGKIASKLFLLTFFGSNWKTPNTLCSSRNNDQIFRQTTYISSIAENDTVVNICRLTKQKGAFKYLYMQNKQHMTCLTEYTLIHCTQTDFQNGVLYLLVIKYLLSLDEEKQFQT